VDELFVQFVKHCPKNNRKVQSANTPRSIHVLIFSFMTD